MPRCIVQRTFPEGLQIPVDGDGAGLCRGVIERQTQVLDLPAGDKAETGTVRSGSRSAGSPDLPQPNMLARRGQPAMSIMTSTPRSWRPARLRRVPNR